MRITKTDVRRQFDVLRAAAINAGVPSAERWILMEGNHTTGVSWRLRTVDPLPPVLRYQQLLGTDLRTVYERMDAMTHLLHFLRSVTASLPQRPGTVTSIGKERGSGSR